MAAVGFDSALLLDRCCDDAAAPESAEAAGDFISDIDDGASLEDASQILPDDDSDKSVSVSATAAVDR